MSGTIRGQAFAVRSATYVVDRRPGYQHVDIRLSSAETSDRCDQKSTTNATSVWLRRKSAGELAAAQARIAPGDDAAWEVHYQTREGEEWLGNGDASALIVVGTVAADLKAHGELWACFADELESCVSGSFVATYCPIAIDAPIRGIEAMERPSAAAAASSRAAGAAASATTGLAATPAASGAPALSRQPGASSGDPQSK